MHRLPKLWKANIRYKIIPFSQDVKIGHPKNTMGVATYFHGHGNRVKKQRCRSS
jgi:hypothetical protein